MIKRCAETLPVHLNFINKMNLLVYKMHTHKNIKFLLKTT
jgi:hypothetical protein